tara:strand:- start:927 stop:1211 length:285 start_codon:yes stop_codon:yes gene_type:complete
MKKIKKSMTTQLQRKGLLKKRYEFLIDKADTVVDIGIKNVYRYDAMILRNEIDRITCYLERCSEVLRTPNGPNREDLDKLYNFKYWTDSKVLGE